MVNTKSGTHPTDIALGKTRVERHAALRLWGFECRCDLCAAPAAEAAASDARREQIGELRAQALDALAAGRYFESLRAARAVINLLPAEGLFPLYSEMYEHLARVYYALRDRENTLRWARRSIDVLAEQGYLDRARPEHLYLMWTKFAEEAAQRKKQA